MKDILIGWIIFQLIIIGLSSTHALNQIKTNKYPCEITIVPVWLGAIFPLTYFATEPQEFIEYEKKCKYEQSQNS